MGRKKRKGVSQFLKDRGEVEGREAAHMREIKEARTRGDSLGYYRLCEKYNVSPDDEFLYGLGAAAASHIEGEAAKGIEQRASGQLSATPAATNGKSREYWSNVARIALARLPERLPGETFSPSVIKRRLGAIKNAGYEIKPYSSMSRDEAFAYLQELRKEIRQEARVNCPDVLAEIADANERQQMSD